MIFMGYETEMFKNVTVIIFIRGYDCFRENPINIVDQM